MDRICVLTPFAKISYPVLLERQGNNHFRVEFAFLIQGYLPWYGIYWRMSKVAEIAQRVVDIVAEQLGVDKEKVSHETSFVNDLGADSLDTVELVMELEEEFDINIPDDAAEKIQTVGQAIEFIEKAQS